MRKQEAKRRSMRDRIRERAAKPRISKFEYLNLPDGYEKFVVEGKTKVTGDKKTLTKRLDVMPYIAGDGNPNCDKGETWFERTYWVHKINLGENNSITFVCPAKTRGEKCPACEMVETLRKDPKSTKTEINGWLPKERQLFNVRDLSDPEKVKIFDVSYHLFGKLLDARINGQDDDDGFDLFAELSGGKTLRVQFEEKKYNGNKFFEAISIDFKDREEDYEEDVINESACLDDLLIVHPYEELHRLLFESDVVVDSDDDDDDDEPKSKKPIKKSSKDEDEDEDDEDEDPEEKPKSKKPVKKSSKDEDEDEEEDSDDEDEEEEPKSKKSSKTKPVKEDEDEDEDEDEEPESKKSSKPAKKPSKDEDEDEEDDSDSDDEGDDEEDEEEEKPKSKKPVKKSSKDEDEDEDDSDSDDEEEEEESKSKKSSKDKSNPCPFGHKFGKDCDEDHCVQDCKDCDKWDECSDAQEKMKK